MTRLHVLGAPGRRAGSPPRHLADLDLAGRRAAVAELGEREFRAGQLSTHYFGRLERDPGAMTDLPAASRERLGEALLPRLLRPVKQLRCDGGTTHKTLWRLHDGALVESVLMGYQDRVTVCVSSQAGCGMGCPFCATGQAGLTRNLSTAEIVDQVVWFAGVAARGELPGCPDRLSRVVFMGMGEPLANYERVIGAVRRITDESPAGRAVPATPHRVDGGAGPAMRRLAGEGLAVTLALSLHAPDDDLRNELVPVNQRWNVAEVFDAAWQYTESTGRRVSVEYAMIRDVNDQPWRADLLGRLLSGRLAHVNLIPLNPTPGSRWDASTERAEREFVHRLRADWSSNDGAGHARPGNRRSVRAACCFRGDRVTSQGQRFRRRALRRGYKVDEVDSFLDRVEATLSGEPVSNPVSSQEVHDVVFRVRFGGYDEWQVDLHLDRVERQLSELEERGGAPRAAEPRGGDVQHASPADRMSPPPDRMGPPMDRMGPPPERMGAPMDRMGPPMDRMGPPQDRMGPPMDRMGPPQDRMGPPIDRMGPPTVQVPPVPAMPPSSGRASMSPGGPPPRDSAYGRFEDVPPFDGFEQGRHGRADMTAEIRMPVDPGFAGPSYGGPVPGGPQGGRPGPGPGPGGGVPTGDGMRVDQLRRTFQTRRFGSGYDRMQVDRLFDGLVAAFSGRGPAVTEADLDPSQFELVSGGYFEAEVNAALREVRDLLGRRR
jgi:23S rRNA (adenine2503-C2)-methyltransferase